MFRITLLALSRVAEASTDLLDHLRNFFKGLTEDEITPGHKATSELRLEGIFSFV